MDLKEFIGLNPNIIRSNTQLMQLYIKFYEAAFFVIPSCAGCSFKAGFKKLKEHALATHKNINFDENIIKMKNTKTFLLKQEHLNKILTYKVEGRTHRKYGNQLTEEFALELVRHGQSDLFKKLPEGSKESKDIILVNVDDIDNDSKYASMDYHKEILPLYADARERTGKQADSRKQEDIIKFLEANES